MKVSEFVCVVNVVVRAHVLVCVQRTLVVLEVFQFGFRTLDLLSDK